MPPGDLTREAVLRAISEYDALGRDAFLAKYGYRPARSYYLSHQGRRFDSKAIAGVAHAYVSSGSPLHAARYYATNDATNDVKAESDLSRAELRARALEAATTTSIADVKEARKAYYRRSWLRRMSAPGPRDL
jgi:hypothetical protein